MARGETIGCFGLTEPTAGSDPASMKTFASKDGSDWVLNGEKRWIGLATIADVAVVWARTDEEKNPSEASSCLHIQKASLPGRQPQSSRCGFDPVRHKARKRPPRKDAMPGEGLSGPFACLGEARYGIIWGSMGAARDCCESALAYAIEREQFGRPIASFQLISKLANMLIEVERYASLHIGRMKDAGTLRPTR